MGTWCRDPVRVRDVTRAVGGQLGAAAADERVDPAARLEHCHWDGERRDMIAPNRAPDRARKAAVGPALRTTVVGLVNRADTRAAIGGERHEKARQLVNLDRRHASAWRQQRNAATVSYTHLRAPATVLDLVCPLLLEKKHHYTTQQ